MRRIPRSLLAILLLCLPATAQSLADSIPASVLMYGRTVNPLQVIREISSSPLLWNNPKDVTEDFFKQVDRGMAFADAFLGMESGSLTTYVNSVTEIEFAVFDFLPTEQGPEIDFVLVLTTPQAERIYEVFSGTLAKRSMAEIVDEQNMELNIGDQFEARIARYGDRIVMSPNPDRVNTVMEKFGEVVPGCLAQSEDFKACVQQNDGLGLYYANLTPILKGIYEFMPRGDRREFDAIAGPLGFWNLKAAGYKEGEKASRAGLVGSQTIPVFDVFAEESGPPDLLGRLPADVSVGFSWPGALAPVWRKGSALLLDSTKFQFAARGIEMIRSLQQSVGLTADEVAQLASGGWAVGWDPSVTEVNDDDAWYGILRTQDPASLQQVAQKLAERFLKRGDNAMTTTVEGGVTWMHLDRGSLRRNVLFAFTDDLMVGGLEPLTKKLMQSLKGERPSLARIGALKGLKPRASIYAFLGTRALMIGENEFTSGYHNMKEGTGLCVSVDITKDRLVVQTTRPVREFTSSFMIAAVAGRANRRDQRVIRKNLGKIHEAWKDYRGKNGKDPKTLSMLGLTEGENALECPKNKENGWKSYALVPMEAPDPSGNDQHNVLAWYKDPAYGRFVVTRAGNTMRLSERSFRRTMSRSQGNQ